MFVGPLVRLPDLSSAGVSHKESPEMFLASALCSSGLVALPAICDIGG